MLEKFCTTTGETTVKRLHCVCFKTGVGVYSLHMIQKDIKAQVIVAMKARDTVRLETLRGLSAAFTNELVAKGKKPTEDLPDENALTVIRREVKKRKEATEAFRKGGREESAAKEEQEQAILEAYLPAMMGEDEIQKVVDAKKNELSISDKKDMGRLMGAVMKELAGKADGGAVKKAVDAVF